MLSYSYDEIKRASRFADGRRRLRMVKTVALHNKQRLSSQPLAEIFVGYAAENPGFLR